MPVRYSDESAGPTTRRTEPAANTVPDLSRVAALSSSQMSKTALQQLAKERGLPASGTKADLIFRLAQ